MIATETQQNTDRQLISQHDNAAIDLKSAISPHLLKQNNEEAILKLDEQHPKFEEDLVVENI